MENKFNHVYLTKIRNNQIDVFGHLNHAKYLEIFEDARWDLITKNGYGAKEIERHQFGPVILEAKIRYKKEVKASDELKILTHTQKSDKKIGSIYQEMRNALTDEVHATIDLLYGLMDMKQRKLVAPTPEWNKAISGNE